MRRVRNTERYHSRHYFLEVPHTVIPNLVRDPGLILSEDGGPLTDNVAFSSVQRVLLPKRTAVLRYEIACKSITK